ncbi:MAG: hypothetical protein IJV76_05310 [Clostridia bacterium]|nr:hypothetical protein [Clostridia bacterium]MBQ9717391.1 hypothetical protein [Clostridia bacterium]
MYYSKNHEGLVFIDRGMGNLEIRGEGVIRREDTEIWNPVENWKEDFTTVTVYEDITEIYAGVLEQFPNMKKLNLPKSLRCIDMTDALKMLLHTNDVLVHAAYGSYGDTFAQEYGLRFLPENIELGWHRDEAHDESTKLVLRFYEDGTMDVLYDIFTTGISAGSNGGASLERPMPKEYYPGCTLEEFADMFPVRYYEQIMNNRAVRVFLQREAERKNKSE